MSHNAKPLSEAEKDALTLEAIDDVLAGRVVSQQAVDEWVEALEAQAKQQAD